MSAHAAASVPSSALAVPGSGPRSALPPPALTWSSRYSEVISLYSESRKASSTVCLRRVALVVSSMSWPAALRSEAEPLNTAVTKVSPVCSSSSLLACSFTA